MAKPKTNETGKTKCCGDSKVLEEFKKAGKKVTDLTKSAYKRFDQADDKTKKSIIAGIAGAAALIAGAIGAKKMIDKKKK